MSLMSSEKISATKIDGLSYIVVDLETSIKNRGVYSIGSNKGNAFHPENKIVAIGLKNEDRLVASTAINLYGLFDYDMIVGHNVGFDCLHLAKAFPLHWYKWVLGGGVVWDTQIAEYLITGQSHLYSSLNELSEKYGGTLKDERIKEYWDNGIETEDIPQDELLEYLKGDLINTNIVFDKQLEDVLQRGMFSLVMTYMESLMATIEMERNGMSFDIERCNDEKEVLESLIKMQEKKVIELVKNMFPDEYEVNINSNEDISKILFGGEVKYKTLIPELDENGNAVLYKSGKRKGEMRYKNVEQTANVKGFGFTPSEKTNKGGVYQTSESVLQELLISIAATTEDKEFLNALLNYKKWKKDLSTYFLGYRKFVWPDRKLHPNFNHCGTATGRLSCSQPNIQNVNNRK